MELIDIKSLIQRVNLNYNDHQMISAYALKDIINTQPKISLDDIKEDIQKYIDENFDSDDLYLAGCGDGAYHALGIMNEHIKENNNDK